MNASRRSFFFKGLGAVAAFLGLGRYLTGCSSSSGNPTSGGNCLANGTSVTIGSNHGHTLTITASNINNGVTAYTLGPASTDNHTHTLTLSARV